MTHRMGRIALLLVWLLFATRILQSTPRGKRTYPFTTLEYFIEEWIFTI